MKIGMALSGGGARGFAHLGVVQAFYEKGIEIDVWSGTSAGSITGAFLAKKMEPPRILEILVELSPVKVFSPAFSWKGLIKLEKARESFLKYFPNDDFSDLVQPLTIAATDIEQGKVRYFEKGEIIRPMIASSSIPVIFDPVSIDGVNYVDGGIVNNLPAEPLKSNVDFLIGSNCNPVQPSVEITGFKNVLERSLLIAINHNTYSSAKICDLFIEPKQLDTYKVFDFGKAREIYSIAYNFTKKEISSNPKIRALLDKEIYS